MEWEVAAKPVPEFPEYPALMSHPWSFFTWLYAKFAERVRQAEIPTDLLVGAAPPVLAENVRQDEEKDDEAVEGIAIGLEPTAEMRSAMAGQLTRFLLGAETGIPPDRIPALLQQIQDDTIAGYRSDRIRKMLQTDFGLAQHLAARVAAQADSLLVSKWRELRARDAGCTRYNWSTSHDERVCPRCRALQGKIFSWDNPPEGGHPGECECWRLVCPDYAKVPVGRLDSRCPNCEVELPRRPRGKTKCRSCKKSIWVRTNSDGQQVLLSEEMLADFDRQKFGPEICRCMAMPILE